MPLLAANGRNTFNGPIHDVLRAYLEAQAKRSAAAKDDFDLGPEGYMMPTVVTFLASWGHKEDIPLLQKLLGYKGYTQNEGPDDHIYSHYGVRQAAKNALFERRVPVPDNIVLGKDRLGNPGEWKAIEAARPSVASPCPPAQ